MKQVIIALTSAAVICAASASFAQSKSESKPSVMETKRVVHVEIKGTGATEAVSRVVTINSNSFTIKPGSSEASKEVSLSGADAPKLMVTYKGIICTLGGVMFKPDPTATESRVSAVVLKLGVKPRTMGMKEEKPECKAFVTVTGKHRQ